MHNITTCTEITTATREQLEEIAMLTVLYLHNPLLYQLKMDDTESRYNLVRALHGIGINTNSVIEHIDNQIPYTEGMR